MARKYFSAALASSPLFKSENASNSRERGAQALLGAVKESIAFKAAELLRERVAIKSFARLLRAGSV